MLISLDSASWELHQYSRRLCGPMKIPNLRPTPGTRTWDLTIARPTLYHRHLGQEFVVLHWLTLYQTQNFGLVQIQSISRRPIKSDSKIEICVGKRKHCGKRKKCWFPFPTMFSKTLSFPEVLKFGIV